MTKETMEQTEALALRVISLKVQNTLRVKAVEIKPGDDPVVTISGKNGEGKTSVVRSMLMSVRGAKAFPKEALHRGTLKGGTELDLGAIKIKVITTFEFRALGDTGTCPAGVADFFC